MCHPQTFLSSNPVIGPSNPLNEQNTTPFEANTGAQPKTAFLIDASTTPRHPSATKRIFPVEKKQCSSCGTFVTPVWRRHSYASSMGMDSSPLTFHPLNNGTVQPENSILFCPEAASQRRYLCNACGIKFKKLTQSPLTGSPRPLAKRKSINDCIDHKEELNVSDLPSMQQMPLLIPNPSTSPSSSPLSLKHIKGQSKIRRPSTSFIYFCREYRKILTKQNPNCSFGQISKILGDMWASLPESHKQVLSCYLFEQIYIVQGQQDEYRYAMEKQAMLSNFMGSMSYCPTGNMFTSTPNFGALGPSTISPFPPSSSPVSASPVTPVCSLQPENVKIAPSPQPLPGYSTYSSVSNQVVTPAHSESDSCGYFIATSSLYHNPNALANLSAAQAASTKSIQNQYVASDPLFFPLRYPYSSDLFSIPDSQDMGGSS